MQRELLLKTSFYRAQRKRQKAWKKVVVGLASIVVFCTTYALILPAITMEPDYICGCESHIHDETCYQIPAPVTVTSLVCASSNTCVHTHTSECYNENSDLICGIADFVLHTHIDSCYDSNGALLCVLPEIQEHTHSETCFQQPHVHGDACYNQLQGDLLCLIEEGTIHTHVDACYTEKQNLICKLEEIAPHAHDNACYSQTKSLVCKVDECEGHTHGDSCKDENGDLSCQSPEIADHTHEDACYQITTTLICKTEETAGHAHAAECFDLVREVSCGLEADVAHTHGTACYAWTPVLNCTKLTAEDCAAPELSCKKAEIIRHTHTAECYDPSNTLICGLLEITEHVHSDTCFVVTQEQATEPVLMCGKEAHEHIESCVAQEEVSDETLTGDSTLDEGTYCGLSAHQHVDTCWAEDGALMCTMVEHIHEELCYLAPSNPSAVETQEEWEADLPEPQGNIAADLIAVAESQIGEGQIEANYIIEDGEIQYYSRYADWWSYGNDPYGDWNAMFVAFCLDYAGISSNLVPQESEAATWPNTLFHYDLWHENDGEFTPIPADLVFFDDNEDLVADRVGIVTVVNEADNRMTVILENDGLVQEVPSYKLTNDSILGYARIPGNEPVTVKANLTETAQNVIDLIDALPTYDEYVAQLEAYYDADDMEGEEAYATAVTQQVKAAYTAYSHLSPEEQAAVNNADKLMALETVWSAETLATYTKNPTIYQINSYEYSWSSGATMAHGGTVGTALGVSWEFVKWIGVIVEEDSNGNLYVEQIADSGTNKNSLKADTANGFVLLFCDSFDEQPNVSVGDLVTVDASIPDKGALKYNSSTGIVSGGYGKVHFSSAINSITSAAPTPVESASTAEFVELNLYDYNRNINTNYWSQNNRYPGFQWNGGAYSNDSGDSDYTDYRYYYTYTGIGIPNAVTDRNVIDSIDFGNSVITNFTYGSGNYGSYTKAVNAANVAKILSKYSESGALNWIYGNDTEGYTNKPIGSSTTDLNTTNTDVMKDVLVNGYPAMFDGTTLDYLFKPGAAVKKMNTSNIDGLFQYNEDSGAYTFNSRENHAEYVTDENRFQLYDEIITPNFITYPFGNFLPLNSISDSTKATQVGAFSYSGGVRDYVERIISDLESNTEGLYSDWKSSQTQLIAMLEEYKENWLLYPRTLNGTKNTWTNLSPGNAIRDYFLGDANGGGDKPSNNISFITPEYLDSMYNIDWDVAKNFFFGMEMKMRFYQPKDGLTGKDNNGDGNFDYPMVFEFTGDDDVWVYIDDVLFLDLSGIHRHVGGKIDFVNGKVYYYELVPSDKGDIKESAYKEFTFAQILTAAGASTDGLNSKGTFEDYSIHNFNFYYMERGSGSSVCRLNFNFPLLRQNTLSVEKALSDDSDSIAALGNPDFQFQVLDADDGSLFLPDGWAYSLYDVNGSPLQEIVVNSKYADGRVESIVIKDANGDVICTETYNSDGTLASRNGSGLDKVLRIGANGIFTLKAGQRAEFVGIPETWGKYYVRELLDDLDLSQYESITVSGVAATKQTVEIGGVTFRGLRSPDLDMANGSSTFRFDNKITTKKLGKLSVSKVLDTYVAPLAETYYRMYVTLDGVPLPVGTKYTVGGVEKTVAEKGYVAIQAGETALIENILSGTVFTVQEEDATAQNFNVSYTVTGANSFSNYGTYVEGVIHTEAEVSVTVTNAQKGGTVKIPVNKIMAKSDDTARNFNFQLVEYPITNDFTPLTLWINDVTTNGSDEFSINYTQDSFETLPAEVQYVVTELPDGYSETLVNTQAFLVSVKIEENTADDATTPLKATVQSIQSGTLENDVFTADTTQPDNPSVTFTNIITGDLKLSKIVNGIDTDYGFRFTVTLTPGTSGVPIADEYPVVVLKADGTVDDRFSTWAFSNGVAVFADFKDGESVTIQNIPYGTQWTITEDSSSANGYTPTYTVTQGGTNAPGEGWTSSGTISTGGTEVVYTNTIGYELPETGGWTVNWRAAGISLLLTLPILYLARRRYRGRRVSGG